MFILNQYSKLQYTGLRTVRERVYHSLVCTGNIKLQLASLFSLEDETDLGLVTSLNEQVTALDCCGQRRRLSSPRSLILSFRKWFSGVLSYSGNMALFLRFTESPLNTRCKPHRGRIKKR